MTSIFLDVSNQTNLLNNLKLIVDEIQSEKTHLKNQVEKLKTDKKQLISSNKNLTNKIDVLEKYKQKSKFKIISLKILYRFFDN